MIVPVILSGGTGSRLWPLSRDSYPKQFLPLIGTQTLLQQTALRVHGVDGVSAPLLVCNEDHRFLASEQLRAVGVQPAATLLEPCGRNTAPAIAVAALHALELFKDPTLLVLPADHLISDADGFRAAVSAAAGAAQDGKLITFGVRPDRPETGYGYIKAEGGGAVMPVVEFVEKPDLDTARHYLEGGQHYWNSGMFLFRARRYLDELERYQPEMIAECRAAHAEASADQDFLRLAARPFAVCPSISIDYAVMEKTDAAVMTPLAVGWSDVGSWAALWQVGERDAAGNVTSGDVITVDATNSLARAESRLVALVGVDDVVVVETADAVLVGAKEKGQSVKAVADRLLQEGRSEGANHRKVRRPWGTYDSVDQDQRFQVKRITVNPGASLSLQMHYHRAEHWIVVKGTALISVDEKTFLMGENESTYIPLGSRHRLVNPGKIPLELIEVQVGSYLGEDDIVRFEDLYGRDGGAGDGAAAGAS